MVVGCGEDEPLPGEDQLITSPATYSFESRFVSGVSSVAYSGQIKRHLLIESIKAYLGSLTDQTFASPEAGQVVSALNFFHTFSSAGATGDDLLNFDPGMLDAQQSTWGDLGSLVDLQSKFPENDANFTGRVVGYGDGSLAPEGVLLAMFAQVEALVIARFNGAVPQDPSGTPIQPVFVGADGVDYQQLIQKYLLGAVPFSQGSDDYLDDDTPGSGLLSDNEVAVDGQPYTRLEHAWDEGFGYFGAARDYGDYTDDEVAGKGGRSEWQGAHDTDNNGRIDLFSEYNFGHSTNASKRDRGSMVATDFSSDAFQAFINGRTLIVNAGGNLTDQELTMLRQYRDDAVGAWERAIAATVVHYINDVLVHMNEFGTPEYSFLDHAKHWSEMKGFALSLQFNVRHSPLSSADLAAIHLAMGSRPVLNTPGTTTSTIMAYRSSLNSAKQTIGTAYGFDAANLGDAQGLGGW